MAGKILVLNNRLSIIALVFVSLLALNGYNAEAASVTANLRPDSWAIPLSPNKGLPNLNRVNSHLYRSAQPEKSGFEFLETQPVLYQGNKPIKTIISLRAFNDDAPLVSDHSKLHLEQIRFKTWHPEDEDVIKFLRIATTPSLQPVLVHCLHGSDRTGTMVAIYRIAYEGWSKRK